MGLFKTQNRKTIEAEVQGEKFLMVEPSALNRIGFFKYHDSLIKELNDDSTNIEKAFISTQSDAYLIAICLTGKFPEMSITAIRTMILEDITDSDDLAIFRDVAEDLSGLKIEAQDVQDENSDID